MAELRWQAGSLFKISVFQNTSSNCVFPSVHPPLHKGLPGGWLSAGSILFTPGSFDGNGSTLSPVTSWSMKTDAVAAQATSACSDDSAVPLRQINALIHCFADVFGVPAAHQAPNLPSPVIGPHGSTETNSRLGSHWGINLAMRLIIWKGGTDSKHSNYKWIENSLTMWTNDKVPGGQTVGGISVDFS